MDRGYDLEYVQEELTSTLDWLVKTVDFQNQQSGCHIEDSDEMKKAKALVKDLINVQYNAYPCIKVRFRNSRYGDNDE